MFEKQKRCSKCGLAFECGGLFGCWCREVTLDAATLATLKERYTDCLCPECLKQLATLDPPARSVV
jgi:Cysteine-rich CWC